MPPRQVGAVRFSFHPPTPSKLRAARSVESGLPVCYSWDGLSDRRLIAGRGPVDRTYSSPGPLFVQAWTQRWRSTLMEGALYQELRIFSGNAHPELAQSICHYLGTPLGECEVFEFSNENIFVRVHENVRQRDVYIVQPMSSPVNTSIMELLIMIDAMNRGSAGRVPAVVPYYAYGRSDNKDQPRVPIPARLLANLIETAGADRVLTVDLHAGQIQGFFNIPVDELTALTQIADHFKN